MNHPLWNQCVAILKNELNAQQFNTWILSLQVKQSDNQLILLAPNQFVRDWVRKQYLDKIATIISQLDDGKSLTVSIMFDSNQTSPGEDRRESHQLREPESDSANGSGLDPSQTFDNYVEGKSNQLALATSIQVSNNPGAEYNPLCIYGRVGLGRTHLMHAVGNQIKANNPDSQVLYLHSESFVSDMVRAMQHGKIDAFRNRFSRLDALLLDDIQFLADKRNSQEAFIHTFDSLYEAGAQMVVSSDCRPKEIEDLDDSLRARLGRGTAVEVEPPDLEARFAILQCKAEAGRIELPEEAVFYIAKRFKSNVRELEHALRIVFAFSQFNGNSITLALTTEALKELPAVQHDQASIDETRKAIAEEYKKWMTDLSSKEDA